MKASKVALVSGAVFMALVVVVSLIILKTGITRDIGGPVESSVECSGIVSEQSIRTEGMASVRRR